MSHRSSRTRAATLVLLMLYAIGHPAAAAQRIVAKAGAVYLVPAGSPVKFASTEEWTAASFDGEFVASGTYEIRYLGAPKADCEVCAQAWSATLRPTRELASRLPHWIRGPVRELDIGNAEAFVDATVDHDVVAQLRSGALAGVSGRATIRVDSFKGQIDCDSATYTARFIELKRPATLTLAARAATEPGNC
jgi:hypothetical protein